MVVDYIQNDGDAYCMRAIDEGAEIIWGAIKPRGCKKIYPVVAPSELSGEICNRHQFDYGNSEIGELLQMLDCGAVCAFLSESADVHFINNLAFDAKSLPGGVGPLKFTGIDSLREFIRAFGLKTRRGIGERAFAIDLIGIASAVSDAIHEATKISVRVLRQFNIAIGANAPTDYELNCRTLRRPDAEVRPCGVGLRAARIPPWKVRHTRLNRLYVWLAARKLAMFVPRAPARPGQERFLRCDPIVPAQAPGNYETPRPQVLPAENTCRPRLVRRSEHCSNRARFSIASHWQRKAI